MTRQDLRNRAPKRSLRLSIVLVALGVLALLALHWKILPPECKTTKTELPRHCVD